MGGVRDDFARATRKSRLREYTRRLGDSMLGHVTLYCCDPNFDLWSLRAEDGSNVKNEVGVSEPAWQGKHNAVAWLDAHGVDYEIEDTGHSKVENAMGDVREDFARALRGIQEGVGGFSPASTNGTWLVGYVTASYPQLVSAFGEPTYGPNDPNGDKVSCCWGLQDSEGRVFTIYDWKPYEMQTVFETQTWHVGGRGPEAVMAVRDAGFQVESE